MISFSSHIYATLGERDWETGHEKYAVIQGLRFFFHSHFATIILNFGNVGFVWHVKQKITRNTNIMVSGVSWIMESSIHLLQLPNIIIIVVIIMLICWSRWLNTWTYFFKQFSDFQNVLYLIVVFVTNKV